MKASAISIQPERARRRGFACAAAVANGARSSSRGQRVVDSDVIRERFAAGPPPPAPEPGA